MDHPSYGRILKSSSIMGGATGIGLLFGLLRMKFAAILIGLSGVGLLTNLTAIQTLVATVTSLGIQLSAVQSVASTAAHESLAAMVRLRVAIRRLSRLTGLLGAGAMVAFGRWFSLWMFNSVDHATQIRWLGIGVLAMNIAGGPLAVLQGMRRIRDVAWASVVTAGVGAVLSIGCYLWLGIDGVVPAMLAFALTQAVIAHYLSSRLPMEASVAAVRWRDSLHDSGPMLRLGVTMMWSSVMAGLVSYISNALITHRLSLAAVGINSAAFALSGLFVNVVLSAMGTDYYPSLSRIQSDKPAMNQLVNEQTEIGLLLASPGVVATLSFAPWIIRILYSGAFLPAYHLLVWYVAGALIRVVQWPMGFLQLVRAKGRWFLVTQTTLNLVSLLFIWLGLHTFGLLGVAIAFFALYMVSLWVIFLVARRLIGFFWSPATLKLFMVLGPAVGVTFVLANLWDPTATALVGAAITAATSVYCLRGLVARVGPDHRLVVMAARIPGMRALCGISLR